MTDINEIVGSRMTHEELIAQAREWLTDEYKPLQGLVYTLEQLAPLRPTQNGVREQHLLEAKRHLNLVTTHLVEMDQHKNYRGLCDSCDNGVGGVSYPCDFLVTKAKRLLGVEG